jgi:uncharacterized protein
MNTERSRARNALSGAAVSLAACVLWMPASQAVIDCSRATSNADRLVCSNDRLASAEEAMARAYRNALRRGVDVEKLRATQREWKASVRDLCNDAACLQQAYGARISELDAY